MAMLIVKLYPTEFRELISYLRAQTTGQRELPLRVQSLRKRVLAEYLSSWTGLRLYRWQLRRAGRTYELRIPEVVALALYQQLQQSELTLLQLPLLAKLDEALVNYRNPYGEAHPIGALIALPAPSSP